MNAAKIFGALSLVAAGLSVTAAQAAMITYDATGVITQADNTAQLPAGFETAAAGGVLSLDFTVDTQALGALNGPGDRSYLSPVTVASATVGSGVVGLSTDLNWIEILHNSPTGGVYQTGYQLVSLSNVSANFTGTASAFALFTVASSDNPNSFYRNESLNNAPLAPTHANFSDGLALIFTSYLDGVAQSTSDIVVDGPVAISRVSNPMSAPEMDPASAAGALTLLFGGLVVLRGRVARSTERRS